MNIKLVQIDGDLPNMALMKLAHYFRHVKKATVHFTRSVRRDLFEPHYDHVFGSAIFSTSHKKIALLKSYHPEAVIGGTAVSVEPEDTVENHLGIIRDYKHLDYSIYPEFTASIGMTQVGCSSKCGFCCVWRKEGKNRPLSNISEIYRGAPHPKELILLDNDFQSRAGWQQICEEIIDGNFKVAFIQGINIRKITEEHGKYFAQMKFRDKNFDKKRFYCAFDNEKDIKRIKRGLEILDLAGIRRSAVTPYFLTNYWTKGLTDDVWNRFLFMAELGLRPYCMIYEKWTLPPNDDLKSFQNWINTFNCYAKPTREGFEEYKHFYRLPQRRQLENIPVETADQVSFLTTAQASFL
jgi:hypothetical protein